MKMPDFDFETHKLDSGYLLGSSVRYGEVPSKLCDYRLTNLEAIVTWGGTKPHYWMSFKSVFPTKPWPNSSCIYADIPNWSWCNFCGQIDTNRHCCEGRVFSDYVSGDCGKLAAIEAVVVPDDDLDHAPRKSRKALGENNDA